MALGGEFRKSYHGYPAGYAQLIQSPHQWVVEPMQIDTHNREAATRKFMLGRYISIYQYTYGSDKSRQKRLIIVTFR